MISYKLYRTKGPHDKYQKQKSSCIRLRRSPERILVHHMHDPHHGCLHPPTRHRMGIPTGTRAGGEHSLTACGLLLGRRVPPLRHRRLRHTHKVTLMLRMVGVVGKTCISPRGLRRGFVDVGPGRLCGCLLGWRAVTQAPSGRGAERRLQLDVRRVPGMVEWGVCMDDGGTGRVHPLHRGGVCVDVRGVCERVRYAVAAALVAVPGGERLRGEVVNVGLVGRVHGVLIKCRLSVHGC
ncbi:hypothetical protein OBBRIDRAFT_639494 [Obba rivulosa]|uniref:Uncharacterized protein n=1 Tax=Obba rivulosa TaxID=1052685 RepID=A0A8E2AXC4_9APHY|nr:hypothetical protein OBBRIDRAFT_639494 [Obba rivulosa]